MNLNYFIFKQLSCAYKTFFIPDFISFGETEVPKTQTLFLVSTCHMLTAPVMSNLFSDSLHFGINREYINNSIFKFHASSLEPLIYDNKNTNTTTENAIKHLQNHKNLVLFVNLSQKSRDIFELALAEKIMKNNSNISYIPIAITGLNKVLPTNSIIPKVSPVRVLAACPALQSQVNKEQLFSELTFLEKQLENTSQDYFPSIFNNIEN